MHYKKPIRELELTAEGLLAWTRTDFGQYILRSEDSKIADKYSKFPGFRCMHLGLSENLDLLININQIHSFTIQSNINTCTGKGSLVSDLSGDELPLDGDEAHGSGLRIRGSHDANDRSGQD